MNRNNRVVITGVGVVSPYGIGKRRFWDGLRKGKSAIRPITGFNTSGLRCKQAAEVKGLNLKHLLGIKGLRHLTRSTQFALVGAKLALDDAGISYPVPEEATDSYGVSLGISTGSTHNFMEFDKEILVKGPRFVDPPSFPNIGSNAAASHISIKFNIKGFNTTISTSSASGLDAISYASDIIMDYGYEVVLAGGAEELSLGFYTALIKLRCLSRSHPGKDKELSRPYDTKRDGIIAGEGACVFVLESFEHASKRKARIYAELKGFGCCFDPRTRHGLSTAAEGAAGAIRQAINESGYPKHRIDYIAGAANSSRGCDYTEARAIRDVFKEETSKIPVSSIKSMIGETFSASGPFNVACAIGALEDDFIPPTINYHFSDRRFALNLVTNKGIKRRLDNILINSLSYNGFNASVVIGRMDI